MFSDHLVDVSGAYTNISAVDINNNTNLSNKKSTAYVCSLFQYLGGFTITSFDPLDKQQLEIELRVMLLISFPRQGKEWGR